VPVWIGDAVVRAIHEAQLAEHGGAAGVRDEGLLASALARPRTLAAYGEPPPDLAALAAAYAFGIARNHGFVDGNKRTSLVVTEAFLRLNGQALVASDAEIVTTWLALADGTLDEAALAAWLRTRI
jgi:death-on-curing protein